MNEYKKPVKMNWKGIAWIVAGLFVGLFVWTVQNVIAQNYRQHEDENARMAKIEENLITITKNLAVLTGQMKDINLPLMNATLLSVDGRVSRIEKLVQP